MSGFRYRLVRLGWLRSMTIHDHLDDVLYVASYILQEHWYPLVNVCVCSVVHKDSRALLEAVLAVAAVFATLALMSVAATVSKRLINNSSRPWLLFGHVASYPRRIYRYRVAYLAGIPVIWPTCLTQFNRSFLICPFIKAIFSYESLRIYKESYEFKLNYVSICPETI